MISGIVFEQRRIILAQVRFSDGTDEKLRPIVIISNQKFNSSHKDIICCPITSEIRGMGIVLKNDKFYLENGQIPKESEIKSQYPLIIAKERCREPQTQTKITLQIANQIITDIKEALSTA